MEEPFEAGIGRALVIDEFDLDRFHGGHCENGLAHTGSQTTQQAVSGAQGALGIHPLLLEFLKSAESIYAGFKFFELVSNIIFSIT